MMDSLVSLPERTYQGVVWLELVVNNHVVEICSEW